MSAAIRPTSPTGGAAAIAHKSDVAVIVDSSIHDLAGNLAVLAEALSALAEPIKGIEQAIEALPNLVQRSLGVRAVNDDSGTASRACMLRLSVSADVLHSLAELVAAIRAGDVDRFKHLLNSAVVGCNSTVERAGLGVESGPATA